MKIKVCGMREAGNIKALAELQPDYLGLIFYSGSKRFVSDTNLGLLEEISSRIKITGVFVNQSEAEILSAIEKYHLKAVQLHGNETPEFCGSLKSALNKLTDKIEIIKAFGLNETFNFSVLEQYELFVDYFLFDTKTVEHGGSGQKFDWAILKNYPLDKPYFLSGGIGLDDLQELRQITDDRFYCADLNSKFEISPGLKDIEKVSQAISSLRQIKKTVNQMKKSIGKTGFQT